MGSLRIFDYCHYAAAILELNPFLVLFFSFLFFFVWSHVWMLRLEDISHHGREIFTPRRAAFYDYFLFIFVEILNPHAFRFSSLSETEPVPTA